MQVLVKPLFIQSFGGINFIHKYLNEIYFNDTVLSHLGCRSLLAQCSYADLIRQLFYICCIGGETLDESHINPIVINTPGYQCKMIDLVLLN